MNIDTLLDLHMEGKVSIQDFLQAKIHETFTLSADRLAQSGDLTRDERIKLSGLIGDVLGQFNDEFPEGIGSKEIEVDLDLDMEEIILVPLKDGEHPEEVEKPDHAHEFFGKEVDLDLETEQFVGEPIKDPFAAVARDKVAFTRKLDALPQGSVFTIRECPGCTSFIGRWTKTLVAGDPFWTNERGEFKASGEFFIASGFIQTEQFQQEIIRKKGSQFCLFSKKKNPKTGERRNLGCFPSKKKAREREGQIQFFKRQSLDHLADALVEGLIEVDEALLMAMGELPAPFRSLGNA